MLRFWAEENPAYAVDIPVTLVEGAYTLPELTVAADYLPQDGLTDAELWTWMQRPLTVVDLKSTSHQKLYAEPSTKSKSLGTVHGQSQGVQILQAPADGWVKGWGAYNHEDGSWTEGYVQEDRLMTLPTDSDYGLLLDKRTQTPGGIPSGDAHRRAQSEHRPGGKEQALSGNHCRRFLHTGTHERLLPERKQLRLCYPL